MQSQSKPVQALHSYGRANSLDEFVQIRYFVEACSFMSSLPGSLFKLSQRYVIVTILHLVPDNVRAVEERVDMLPNPVGERYTSSVGCLKQIFTLPA